MIGLGLVALYLASGLTFGNLADWAAPARGVIMALMVLAWLFWILRSGYRFQIGAAGLIGIVAAMMVSDAANTLNDSGVWSWLVYLGAYSAQCIAPRNWRNDLAMAGAILSVFIFINEWVGLGTGLWNRNMIAMAIMILLPAMIARWNWLGVLFAIPALMTGSRGAWMSLIVVSVVIAWPHLNRWLRMSTVSVIPVALGALALVRPGTSIWRIRLAGAALSDWWATSPMFGLGPGRIWITPDRIGDTYGFAHAHQTAISIGAQVGLLGLVIIVIMLAFSKRQAWSLWELATLAVVGVLSLFEDVAMVWQVGIAASIVLAGNQIREKIDE